jgi:hypothetical protein
MIQTKIVRAGKGKTIMIVKKKAVQDTVLDFNANNGLVVLDKYSTKRFHKKSKGCDTIIDKGVRNTYVQRNPKAPRLKAMVKLHKEG